MCTTLTSCRAYFILQYDTVSVIKTWRRLFTKCFGSLFYVTDILDYDIDFNFILFYEVLVLMISIF